MHLLLKCCMPVFKGLLPRAIDLQAQRLLFTFATWHALAKLRQHTSATLSKLSDVTSKLGNAMRAFQSSTSNLEVFETPRELSARQRRAAARAQHRTGSEGSTIQITRKRCELNLNTFKFHALGDYVSTISQYGTTDSFSTQTVMCPILNYLIVLLF
jgi:Sec-independent protein translocase protein TatA